LGIGDWGLGPIPNPQSPIPNPQSPLKLNNFSNCLLKIRKKLLIKKFLIKNVQTRKFKIFRK